MRVSPFSCAISAATPRVAQYQYAPESLDAFKIFSTITLAGRCIQKKVLSASNAASLQKPCLGEYSGHSGDFLLALW